MKRNKPFEIGGSMASDINRLADISDESMRLDRLAQEIEKSIISENDPEVVSIWMSLNPDQKKAAVFMAEKQRKETKTICEECGRKMGNHVVEGGSVEVLCWVCDEYRVRKGREWLENNG